MEDEEVKEDPGPPGWPWHDRPGHQICDFLQNSAEFPDPLSPGEGSPLLWEAPPQDPHGIVQNSMEFSDLLPQEKGPPFSGAADSGIPWNPAKLHANPGAAPPREGGTLLLGKQIREFHGILHNFMRILGRRLPEKGGPFSWGQRI